MEFTKHTIKKDLVIAGAGFAGICAAIEAARQGLSVALINNRGYLGGNSSAEIRCPVDGADGEQQFNFFSRETGVIEEIRLKNLYLNPQGNSYRWDAILMDFIYAEQNIEVFLNTTIDKVSVKNEKHINYISGIQSTSEKRFLFYAQYFVDNTGDGTIAFLANCEYTIGSEASKEFNEKIAPERRNSDVLLSTLTYFTRDTGTPVPYAAPGFALDISETDILKYREIPKEMFHRFVWFYEVGGGLDQIKDAEKIIYEHRKLVYGIWDYVKKHNYGAENFDFEYVAPVPGKRESRRIKGQYMLTEQDIALQNDFDDAAGYGGWAIDLHSPQGFYGTDVENWWVYLKGIYSIPLKCAIAKDVDNLFLIGRCFSVSRVALGSTRLQATLATIGQAVGLAASISVKNRIKPKNFSEREINKLQQLQLKNDHYLIGKKNTDPKDLARTAKISVSSTRKCTLEIPESFFTLTKDIGFVIPVQTGAEKISFIFKSTEETTLSYKIFIPAKKQNYAPEKLMEEGIVRISQKTNDFTDIFFKNKNYQGYIFIEILKNPKVEMAITSEKIPGIVTIMKEENKLPNVRNYDTLEIMKDEWEKFGMVKKLRKYSTAPMKNITYTPCFKVSPDQDIYGAWNINNGFTRPYQFPNIWVSEKNKDENIEFSFDKEESISEVYIYFNSDLNFRIRNVKTYDFNIMPEIVKTYTLYYFSDNSYQPLLSVKDNYQRMNKLTFATVKTTKLKIEFSETNGSSTIGVYGVRIY